MDSNGAGYFMAHYEDGTPNVMAQMSVLRRHCERNEDARRADGYWPEIRVKAGNADVVLRSRMNEWSVPPHDDLDQYRRHKGMTTPDALMPNTLTTPDDRVTPGATASGGCVCCVP